MFELANVFLFSRPLPPDDRREGSGKQKPLEKDEESGAREGQGTTRPIQLRNDEPL
jgi:hypothetical protein